MLSFLPVWVLAKAKERGSSNMPNLTKTLPLELIREILLRLPVRSVLRFKCVCKSWLSLISDPQFAISHYDLAAAPSHRLLLRTYRFYVESIDIEAPLKNYFSAVHLLLPPSSPPRPLQLGEHNYHSACIDNHEILGSCKGFIVLYYKRNNDLILWNPSTGFHKRFLNFANELTYLLCGFGYDTSVDDYLLILIDLCESKNEESEDDDCKLEIAIFSFKTGNWVLFAEIHVSYKNFYYDDLRVGSLLNGALHWMVCYKDRKVPVIIAFDLIQRSLLEIPLLDHLTMKKYEAYSLSVMDGCLSVCYSVRGCGMIEIWVMKIYKVQSSWTKSVVIPTYGKPQDFFSPICITKDGGIFGSNYCGKLEKFNDKGELLEKLIYGRSQGFYTTNLQSSIYRESLLSLPSVCRQTRDVQ
ncbi:hypothetical protein AAZX31_10G111700 [Glycine max]|uniref:F-box domain-containing protein n=2 Tax=Glycine subgen. Soja TaxID=1462606 RepID=K7LIU0_SOYBN|nr:F-box/kelch-repeat protein At3g23880-like [Glycine max]KAG4997018.1 hypothetical protein JHK85_028457 [Glycine max]KAG5003807.1 hypothetical protein JHK86_027946 [Glycine max]KAG5151585.1 hypothetical protein JHK84_028057 [Glycine max]KAH1137812.1 hypothetical protein GYH30_027706 [Glycine max]KRH33350.1 hypothetical protein GLYMA_10G117700v4 [Glycine max]